MTCRKMEIDRDGQSCQTEVSKQIVSLEAQFSASHHLGMTDEN